MLSQTTVTILIVLESVGLVATLSILGAALVAWRKAKAEVTKQTARVEALKAEFKRFTDALANI